MKHTYVSTKNAMGIPINYMLKKARGKNGRRTEDDPVTCVAKIEYNNKQAVLWDIWTEPAYRGKGYAKALLKKICSLYDKVWTGWNDSTDGGKNVCLACGFNKAKLNGEWYLLWSKEDLKESEDGSEGTTEKTGGEVGGEPEGETQAGEEG